MNDSGVKTSLKDMTSVFDQLIASLSALQSLGRLDMGIASERALVREAGKALVEHCGIERCTVFSCTGNQLLPVAMVDWRSWDEPVADDGADAEKIEILPVETAALFRLDEGGAMLVSNDVLNDQRLRSAAIQSSAGGGEVRSLVCTPIMAGEVMIAAAVYSHSEPGYFDPWIQRLFPLFSSFFGQILCANRLLRKLEDEVKERTRRLEGVLQETRQLKQHYRSLALLDPLTGLFNRRFLFSEGMLVVGRALRYRHPVSFVLLDIDGLKEINDRLGHAAGDMVLKDVAKVLGEQLRESDLLARIGGDEFALLLPETGPEGAGNLAERLLGSLRDFRWLVSGEALRVSASIGCSSFAAKEETPGLRFSGQEEWLEKLFSGADSALYQAKRAGGDRACLKQL